MDICIITKDNMLARFIELELAEAGFSSEQSERPLSNARLTVCDLDSYAGELPSGAIGFSYDTSKANRADAFLPRPINASALIAAVSEKLSQSSQKYDSEKITLTQSTRKIKTSLGEVRLSEKELALLLKLHAVPTLSRENAAGIFGDGDSNIVDVYMHYLRKKLKKICPYDAIKAKRNEGYSLIIPIDIM